MDGMRVVVLDGLVDRDALLTALHEGTIAGGVTGALRAFAAGSPVQVLP